MADPIRLMVGQVELEAEVSREEDTVRLDLSGGGLRLRFELHAHDAARLAEEVDRAVHAWLDEEERSPDA